MRVKFKDLPAGDYVTKVACGAYHTSFLTRFNQVYVTGANNLGQLGIDSLESQVNLPTLVKTLTDKIRTLIFQLWLRNASPIHYSLLLQARPALIVFRSSVYWISSS